MVKRRAIHSEKEVPKVNKELSGFDIKINSFGEIITSYDLDKINDFLDKNVEDKKLKNRSEFLNKKHEEEGDEEISEEEDEEEENDDDVDSDSEDERNWDEEHGND